MEYREVQKIAKDTIAYIRNEIKAGMSLMEVRRLCPLWTYLHLSPI